MRGIRVWARLLGLARAVVEDVWIDDDGAVIVAARPGARDQGRCGACRRLGHAYAPRGGPVDCVALGNRSRAGAPESGREALAYACRWRGAVPVVVPSPAHITEPVLRHTALGQCSRDGLHATVCRHRFPSVRSIRLARWSTGPRWA